MFGVRVMQGMFLKIALLEVFEFVKRCRPDDDNKSGNSERRKESSPRLYLGKQLEQGGTPGTGPLTGDVTERQR